MRKKQYEIEPHLYVSDSKVAGKGLFTSKKINKDEPAFIMKGPIIKFSPNSKEEACQLPNIVGIKDDYYIDPIDPYVYINHSCNPNTGYKASLDEVTFFALRDILPGEELVFDYSTSEFTDWEMSCSCGSKKCRQIIKSVDNLPPEVFEEYFPHIPDYFQRVYIKKYIGRDLKADNKIKKMDKKSKILFSVLLILIGISLYVSYNKLILRSDFDIFVTEDELPGVYDFINK